MSLRPRPSALDRALRAVALLAAMLAAAPAVAQPAKGPQHGVSRRNADQAVKLHDEARALYEAGEYRKAITKLERAAELDPTGKELIYNLALIHEKLGEMDPAEQYYQRYLEMEDDPALRERTQKALKRIEGAKKELAARHAEELERDRARAAPPPPAGSAPPPAPSRPITPWVWASGGAAVAAFLVGNVFAVSAVVKSPGEDAHTGDGVGVDDLRADAESAHRRAVVADVCFIVAALATGTGAVLFLTTPVEPASPARAGSAPNGSVVEVAAAGSRAALRVRF